MSKRLDDLNAKLRRTFRADMNGPVVVMPSFRRDDDEAFQSRFMGTLGDLADTRVALADASAALAEARAKLAAVPRAPVEIAAGAIAPAGDGSPTVTITPRHSGEGLLRYLILRGPRQTVEAKILRDGANNMTAIELRPIDEEHLNNGVVPNPGPPQ